MALGICIVTGTLYNKLDGARGRWTGEAEEGEAHMHIVTLYDPSQQVMHVSEGAGVVVAVTAEASDPTKPPAVSCTVFHGAEEVKGGLYGFTARYPEGELRAA
jgi:hypothetical protein